MDFKDLVKHRRSHRSFTDAPVSDNDLRTVLRAALMAPTSRHRRSWHFYVTRDKSLISQLSQAKDSGAEFMKDAPAAIIVTGMPHDNECWIEDCSIALVTMQYQAEELGLGTCWVQMRCHAVSDGTMSDTVIHRLVDIPQEEEVLAVLAIGHPADTRKLQDEDALKWNQVHFL